MDWLRMVALCSDHKVASPFGLELMHSHQPRYTMSSIVEALGTQFLVDAWTALRLLAGMMGRLDVAQQLLVTLRAGTWRTRPNGASSEPKF